MEWAPYVCGFSAVFCIIAAIVVVLHAADSRNYREQSQTYKNSAQDLWMRCVGIREDLIKAPEAWMKDHAKMRSDIEFLSRDFECYLISGASAKQHKPSGNGSPVRDYASEDELVAEHLYKTLPAVGALRTTDLAELTGHERGDILDIARSSKKLEYGSGWISRVDAPTVRESKGWKS